MRKRRLVAVIGLGAFLVCLSAALPNQFKPPAWFNHVDTDKDGQVSLYEWRQFGGDIEKFRELDPNNDGFITKEEIIQYVTNSLELKFKDNQINLDAAIEETHEEKYRGKGAYKVFTIKLKKG